MRGYERADENKADIEHLDGVASSSLLVGPRSVSLSFEPGPRLRGCSFPKEASSRGRGRSTRTRGEAQPCKHTFSLY